MEGSRSIQTTAINSLDFVKVNHAFRFTQPPFLRPRGRSAESKPTNNQSCLHLPNIGCHISTRGTEVNCPLGCISSDDDMTSVFGPSSRSSASTYLAWHRTRNVNSSGLTRFLCPCRLHSTRSSEKHRSTPDQCDTSHSPTR